jgi:hypothetical protein
VGDGKHTETPGCAMTRLRLRRYFRWMTVCGARFCIAALCVSRFHHRRAWLQRLLQLGATSALNPLTKGYFSPDQHSHVVWVVFETPHRPCLKHSK